MTSSLASSLSPPNVLQLVQFLVTVTDLQFSPKLLPRFFWLPSHFSFEFFMS